eukprot:CAMPEP_0119305476 /NCGR_PEP_ID=MMETSP1333-20130426/6475_1 /TAXON_ID=418940 /ORGANISM="Scyphosphaera apsteinii, Strain RCC1455" /LENGTH=31 /DNA_ID= /DNA_START= /DNA_END= /DNA_ORIENTATION=
MPRFPKIQALVRDDKATSDDDEHAMDDNEDT